MPKMSFTDFLPAGAYRLRRAAVMTVGVLFMGFAVAALVQADLGTDPFTTACLAFAARMGWLLGSAELLVNAVMFCLVLWQDPHRIGLGTLANMVLVGYTADFFGWVFRLCGITAPAGGAARFVFMVAAIAVFVVAASLYMTADLGTAPYDAMSFVLATTLPHLPFRAVRMAWDAAWVVLTLVLGGSVGPVTIGIIQAVHLRFPEEYLEENLENTFPCVIVLGAIPFRRVLMGRVFQLIQPWSIQQVVSVKPVIYGCKIVFFSQPI